MNLDNLRNLPAQAIAVLQRADSGDYERAVVDELVERRRLKHALPRMTDEQIWDYLRSVPPPEDPWIAVCQDFGLLTDDRLLTPLGRAALDLARPTPEPPVEKPKEPPEPDPKIAPSVSMTWQEAAERMKRLRNQGEPWTSQHKLAAQFGCSSGTICKAIKRTPELQNWAKLQSATTPKAQSLNKVVTDRTAQGREPNPADDAAIREYLERDDLTPDERAFFNSLSRDDQLFFLNDPDKHHQIRGRKP